MIRCISYNSLKTVVPFVLAVLSLYSLSALVTQAKRESSLPNNTVPHSDITALERPWQTNSLCGPNALFLLAKLHGKQISYSDIRDAITVDPDRGSSFADLLRVSDQLKLGFVARKVRFAELANIPTPFIAHLRREELKQASGHFVIVAEIAATDGRIYAYGNKGVRSEWHCCLSLNDLWRLLWFLFF